MKENGRVLCWPSEGFERPGHSPVACFKRLWLGRRRKVPSESGLSSAAAFPQTKSSSSAVFVRPDGLGEFRFGLHLAPTRNCSQHRVLPLISAIAAFVVRETP